MTKKDFALWFILGALITLVLTVVVANPLGAQIPDDQRPPLVTDYANYPGTPQAFLTPGCDFSGVINPTFGTQNIATGALFGPVASLDQLPDLSEADLVRMAWTDVAPECIGSAVSFVVKVALGPSFDPNVDQLTGPNGGYAVEFLVAGPGEITFPMPDLARFGLGCDYQLDAIVGIPLRDVGPSGSFFSEALRVQQGKQTADNRTTVISAKNGTYPSCDVPAGTTTTVPVPTQFQITVPSTVPDTPRTTLPEVTRPTAPEISITSPRAEEQAPPETSPPSTRRTVPMAVTGVDEVTPMAPLFAFAAAMFGLMFLSISRKIYMDYNERKLRHENA
jgi:hypothetical protein